MIKFSHAEKAKERKERERRVNAVIIMMIENQ